MEWQSHERARNAWDIERAEMKAKIAKQEGDGRKAKKLNEQLDKQIRMLEKALKNERARSNGNSSTNAAENGVGDGKMDKNGAVENKGLKKEWEEKAVKGELAICFSFGLCDRFVNMCAHTGGIGSNLDNSTGEPYKETQDSMEAERDALRDKSKHYLTKCVEEITYLLTPPSHPQPPPQQRTDSSSLMGQPDSVSIPLDEMFLQQRQKFNQAGSLSNYGPSTLNQQHHLQNSQLSSQNYPDHLLSNNTAQLPQQQRAAYMTRETPSQQGHAITSSREAAALSQSQAANQFSINSEEPLEQITHSFDNRGRPTVPRQEEGGSLRQIVADEPDGWAFDDPATSAATTTAPSSLDPSASEQQSSRRPDTDTFPSADSILAKSPPRTGSGSHRRRISGGSAMIRRRSSGQDAEAPKPDHSEFRVRYALRGHLYVVRSVVFTGGGSPSEPEICTAGDDGMIKRWIIPANYGGYGSHQHQQGSDSGGGSDLDIQSYFTHRGHEGIVTSLAACCPSASFSTGGRVLGDGWIFSGGQDTTVRVWERGRVDPKATLEGHTDAVWTVCLLPATAASALGADCNRYGGPDRVLLASGSADGTVKIWSVSTPPQLTSPSTGSRRGIGGSRRHSVTSGSNFPSSPQPSVASSTPFHYTLVHSINRTQQMTVTPSPTCINPLSPLGDNFVVSYDDSSILIFDTRTGEELVGMASKETYDGTPKTGVNAVVTTSVSLLPEGTGSGTRMGMMDGQSDEDASGGAVSMVMHRSATGSSERGGVEGVIISGHEDRYIRFFDANSGMQLSLLIIFFFLICTTC